MGRPTLPKSIHILKGSDKANPARMKARENEPENTKPLGKPPSELNNIEKKYFNQIASESIAGVLGEADRIAVSLAAKLMALTHSPEGATAAQTAQLIKLLSQFGMTPSDRSKLSIEPIKKPVPSGWDTF
jgi:hypothetical protein